MKNGGRGEGSIYKLSAWVHVRLPLSNGPETGPGHGPGPGPGAVCIPSYFQLLPFHDSSPPKYASCFLAISTLSN